MLLSYADIEKDTDAMGGIKPIYSEYPNMFNNGVIDSYGSIPLQMDEVREDALILTCWYHFQDIFVNFW